MVSETSKTQATDAYRYLNKMNRTSPGDAQRAFNKLRSLKFKDGWNIKQFEENFSKTVDTIKVADSRLMSNQFQLAILFMDAISDEGPNADHWRRRKDMLGMVFKSYDEEKLGDPLKYAVACMEEAHNSAPMIRKGEDFDLRKTTSLLKNDQMKGMTKEKQKLLKEGRCFHCQQQGHKQSECPELKEKAEKAEKRRLAKLKRREKIRIKRNQRLENQMNRRKIRTTERRDVGFALLLI